MFGAAMSRHQLFNRVAVAHILDVHKWVCCVPCHKLFRCSMRHIFMVMLDLTASVQLHRIQEDTARPQPWFILGNNSAKALFTALEKVFATGQIYR